MANKILVFGGSFSPPTLAHEAIIRSCLSMRQFDEVWLMPSGDRRDKRVSLSDERRLRLLEIVKADRFGANPRLKISDFELSLPRPTNTNQTLRELARSFPNADFWFAFGRDSYLNMPKWPEGRFLQKTLNMVVFCTGAGPVIAADNIIGVDLGNKYSEISSTDVRRALGQNQNLGGLVSEPVASHLQQIGSNLL